MWLPEVLMCAGNRYLHVVSTCLNQVYTLQELEHANHHGSNLTQFKHKWNICRNWDLRAKLFS